MNLFLLEFTYRKANCIVYVSKEGDVSMHARSSAGEPRVLINREALLHNARVIRKTVGPAVSVCAVIKADAYGHGAAIIADTLCNYPLDEMGNPPVNMLAVASIDEAMALQEPGIPVMVLRPVENCYIGRQRQQIEHAIRNEWILTVCSSAAIDDVARIALAMKSLAYVQIMVDSGMSRSGVRPADFSDLIERLRQHVSVRLFGFSTHFACSEDRQNSFTQEQLQRFNHLTQTPASTYRQNGMNLMRHAANSGGVFFWPDSHLDMVRPGLSLYGIAPTCDHSTKLDLRPVMKWTANILLVRQIPKDTGVGYGQTWHAPRDTRLGLIPVGYADGYLRSWSNHAVMMVHDQPAPVVGRISMDLTLIDLTDIPDAQPGDEVTIMDDNPASPASVYNLAKQGDTIPYEIFCRIGSRVHRVPVGDPKIATANLLKNP